MPVRKVSGSRSVSHDKFLADEAAEKTKEKIQPGRPSTDNAKASIVTKLDVGFLEAWFKTPRMHKNAVFEDWPGAERVPRKQRKHLPAVIAFEEDPPRVIWGYDAVDHPGAISHLRTLLEPPGQCDELRNQSEGRIPPGMTPLQVVAEFLGLALEYVRSRAGLSGSERNYSFLVPSHWREAESNQYLRAIKAAIGEGTEVSILRDMEAAALYFANHLFASRQSQTTGVLFLTDEGITLKAPKLIKDTGSRTTVYSPFDQLNVEAGESL
jgi:hypothetical protein